MLVYQMAEELYEIQSLQSVCVLSTLVSVFRKSCSSRKLFCLLFHFYTKGHISTDVDTGMPRASTF